MPHVFFNGIIYFNEEAWYKAQLIAHKIVRGEIPQDITAIREQIAITPSIYPDYLLNLVYILLIIVWGMSILDSYRIAKREVTAN